jgi:hypothetical protein
VTPPHLGATQAAQLGSQAAQAAGPLDHIHFRSRAASQPLPGWVSIFSSIARARHNMLHGQICVLCSLMSPVQDAPVQNALSPVALQGAQKFSAEEVSAAISREFGHSLADHNQEGSATSDEVHHPK